MKTSVHSSEAVIAPVQIGKQNTHSSFTPFIYRISRLWIVCIISYEVQFVKHKFLPGMIFGCIDNPTYLIGIYFVALHKKVIVSLTMRSGIR